MVRYVHLIEVLSTLGWRVEDTDDGLAVIAGPVDPESDAGFIRVDVPVGTTDNRKEKLEGAARELADQMLLATWSVVAKEPESESESESESPIILPFPDVLGLG